MNTLELLGTLKPLATTLAQQGDMRAALKLIDAARDMRDHVPYTAIQSLKDEIGHITYPNGQIGFVQHRGDEAYRSAMIVRSNKFGAGWGPDILNIGSAAIDRVQNLEWQRTWDDNFGSTWVKRNGTAYFVQFSPGKVILKVEGKTSDGDLVISVFAVEDHSHESGWFCNDHDRLEDVLLWCIWPSHSKLTFSSNEQYFETGSAYIKSLDDTFIASLPVIDYEVPEIITADIHF